MIYFAGVIVTVFTTIEIGIYTTVAASGALLLYRVAKADGEFLGRLAVRPLDGGNGSNVYLPLDHADGSNPAIPVEEPHPGVFIFRFSASFLYPNAVHVTDQLTAYVLAKTKRTNPATYGKLGDRPWNLPGPRYIDPDAAAADSRPKLKAIILDFSAVSNIDVSSTQVLIDVRKQLDRHADPDQVEWHFVSVTNPWTRRALTSAGFGRAAAGARAVFSVAEVGASVGGFGFRASQAEHANVDPSREKADEEIAEVGPQETAVTKSGTRVPVLSTDYPAFHLTTEEAVFSVTNALKVESSRTSPTGSMNKVPL